MELLRVRNSIDAMLEGLRLILLDGSDAAPRGMATRECLGTTFVIADPRDRWVSSPYRRLNPAFAIAETVWILAGSSADWIYEYNQTLKKFHDPDGKPGVYGPRLRSWPGLGDQLRAVVDELQADPASRRAVIQIYDPSEDGNRSTDIPCTLSHRFLIRDNALTMFSTMRSQDAWLGFPYDLFFGSVLQELIAGFLGVAVGERSHHADSFHLYEPSLEAARTFVDHAEVNVTAKPLSLAVPLDELDEILNAVVRGRTTGHAGWDTWATAMKAYRLKRAGDAEGSELLLSLPADVCEAFSVWFDGPRIERRFP